MSLPLGASIGVLNLFQLDAQAQYEPEDLEFGTSAANVSGEEAYTRYGAVTGKFLDDRTL
ncbi:MAG: hypothetical protein ACI9J0_002323 [Cryomorphaceae bacterium]|jgi:hypothetical protein